jgi:single-strand DNA-binding protein
MSLNKVLLIGNVGKDPEVRYVSDNLAVANFSIATTKKGFKTNDGKEVPDKTEWHTIVCWRGLAKLAEQYIKKGTQVYVEGELQTRSWEKDGVTRYTTEILANDIQLLGRKADNLAGESSVAPSMPSQPVSQEDENGELPF